MSYGVSSRYELASQRDQHADYQFAAATLDTTTASSQRRSSLVTVKGLQAKNQSALSEPTVEPTFNRFPQSPLTYDEQQQLRVRETAVKLSM